jgi:hypothetical protein
MPQRGFNTRMKRSSSRVVNVWDLRRVAQKRIPRVVFGYLDGGAEGESRCAKIVMRLNQSCFGHGRP